MLLHCERTRYAMFHYHPGRERYMYTLVEMRFDASSPNQIKMKRRILVTKELFETEVVLRYCSSPTCPKLLGKPFYEYTLLATGA